MRNRRHICILSFSNIARATPVLRRIEYASREYVVDVIGHGEWIPPWPNVQFHAIKRHSQGRIGVLSTTVLLLVGRIIPNLWIKAYWSVPRHRQALRILLGKQYSMIHANALDALPVSVVAAEKTGAKVLFDAHEYSPGQGTYSLGGRRLLYSGYVRHLLRKFGPRSQGFITVAEGIARLYKQNFNLHPEIVMNASIPVDVGFRPVDPTHIRLIHHGAAKPRRQLEKFIKMTESLDRRYTVHFMLRQDSSDYVHELKRRAAMVAPDRVFFRAPVLPSQVVSTLADFDIGVHIPNPAVQNSRYALPNKFFDFIAAGLAVAIAPTSQEMVDLVMKHDFGIVSEGFKARDLAGALNRLTADDINRMKRNALKAARSLNADVEMRKLLNIYKRLLAEP